MTSQRIGSYAYVVSFSPKPQIEKEKKDCFKLVINYKFNGDDFPTPIFMKYNSKKKPLHGVFSFGDYPPNYICKDMYIIIYSVNSLFVPKPVGFFKTYFGAYYHANNELPENSRYHIVRITKFN